MNSKEKISKISKNRLKLIINKSNSFRDILKNIGVIINGKNLELLKSKINEYELDTSNIKGNLRKNKNIKENIFESIDTKEKAYWLGFIAADGYVPKGRNKISFCLSVKDESHLDKFIKFIGGDINSKYYPTSTLKPSVMFSVSNNTLSESIKKQGIVSPKSKKNLFIEFDDVQLTLSYLLGYYDGDGVAGTPSISSGCKKTLVNIKKFFKCKGKIRLTKNKWGQAYILYFGTEGLKKMFSAFKYSLHRKRLIKNKKSLTRF